MTAEFRRRKTSARGGFTPAEREKVDELLRLWARRSSRTTPINPGKIICRPQAAAYCHCGLSAEMAFAYGAALGMPETRASNSRSIARSRTPFWRLSSA